MTVDMDLASWKQLPSDVQVFTLAMLPLRQLVSSRCVSKELRASRTMKTPWLSRGHW
uniref:F-box domain-containing protein n=1 Tax=Physcomitrium patens TaxID=3218 RepID=A0A2K1IXF6_PHYPA|nr:hypothetical protein PHYPA_023757 [Physcomitrium patens]